MGYSLDEAARLRDPAGMTDLCF
uniref:Uncharacterized protein n=1 Tax=Anguilla anguilla TaxID=7936 RepID=A0A0E9PJD4_ANGAN